MFGEQLDYRLVGRRIDRRRGDPDLQHIARRWPDLVAPRPRLNLEKKTRSLRTLAEKADSGIHSFLISFHNGFKSSSRSAMFLMLLA